MNACAQAFRQPKPFTQELIPYVDVLKARVDLADADNQLSIAKNNENRQRVALFSLMNLPLDPDTDFVGEDAVIIGERPTYDLCFDAAAEHRQTLKAWNINGRLPKKQAAVAFRRKYLPVVRVEAGYYDQDNDYLNLGNTGNSTYDRDQTNQYWAVGLTVSWDLFDGGRSWYESEKNDLESLRFSPAARGEQHHRRRHPQSIIFHGRGGTAVDVVDRRTDGCPGELHRRRQSPQSRRLHHDQPARRPKPPGSSTGQPLQRHLGLPIGKIGIEINDRR